MKRVEIFVCFYVRSIQNSIRKSVNNQNGVMKWLIWKENCWMTLSHGKIVQTGNRLFWKVPDRLVKQDCCTNLACENMRIQQRWTATKARLLYRFLSRILIQQGLSAVSAQLQGKKFTLGEHWLSWTRYRRFPGRFNRWNIFVKMHRIIISVLPVRFLE